MQLVVGIVTASKGRQCLVQSLLGVIGYIRRRSFINAEAAGTSTGKKKKAAGNAALALCCLRELAYAYDATWSSLGLEVLS